MLYGGGYHGNFLLGKTDFLEVESKGLKKAVGGGIRMLCEEDFLVWNLENNPERGGHLHTFRCFLLAPQ